LSSHSKKAGKLGSQDEDTIIPEGGYVLPLSIKQQYDTVPIIIYYPNPYDAISVLKNSKDPHQWLVAGWYLGVYKERGKVAGLMYKPVKEKADIDQVTSQVKIKDKDSVVHIAPEDKPKA
jgi:hypothetical protein